MSVFRHASAVKDNKKQVWRVMKFPADPLSGAFKPFAIGVAPAY